MEQRHGGAAVDREEEERLVSHDEERRGGEQREQDDERAFRRPGEPALVSAADEKFRPRELQILFPLRDEQEYERDEAEVRDERHRHVEYPQIRGHPRDDEERKHRDASIEEDRGGHSDAVRREQDPRIAEQMLPECRRDDLRPLEIPRGDLARLPEGGDRLLDRSLGNAPAFIRGLFQNVAPYLGEDLLRVPFHGEIAIDLLKVPFELIGHRFRLP